MTTCAGQVLLDKKNDRDDMKESDMKYSYHKNLSFYAFHFFIFLFNPELSYIDASC